MTTATPPETTHAPLTLQMFGPFDVCRDGQPLPRTRTRKEPWLLALLALRPRRRVDRVWLAETLWPDSAPEQALRNLRRSLSDLRAALGPADVWRLCSPTPGTVAFDGAGAHIDVAEFDDAVRCGTPDALARAVALYRGPLLEGCDEDWARPERQSREDDCLRALETLAARRLDGGDPGGAVPLLRRAVALAPLRETALRALMTALAAQGEAADAAQAYHNARLRLHCERNADVGEETAALFRQIQARARHQFPKPSAPAPPPAPDAPHLPRPLTSLVGRTGDVQSVRALLARSRLVTLTGTGGIGKTRLAVEAARWEAPAHPEGAWFVDLAPLTSTGLVARTVAQTLGVRAQPPQSLAETLAAVLHSQRLLLVLDNCEHVLGECAALARSLLDSCPRLTILATSREVLGVEGEAVCRVDPLPVPADAPGQGADAVLRCEAARLFAERARAPGGQLLTCAGSADALAQLCRRLDGIPLAIELAAARTGVMTVEQIAGRLDDRFRLLTGGSRSGLPRQQTLRALLDWSYDLLTEGEKALFARLSVFAGGWTVEAAEAACAGDGLAEADVLDALARLEDKSLLTAEPQGGAMRHGLLETLRQYAADRLALSGDGAVWQRRHRDYFLQLVEQADPQLVGPEQGAWLARLGAEQDNLRAALTWSLAQPDGAGESLRLCAALGRFWQIRAHLSEGRDWCRRALAQAGADGPTPARAWALHKAGELAWRQSDLAAAQRLGGESLALFGALEDRRGQAAVHILLASVASAGGDATEANSRGSQALALYHEVGDKVGIAAALFNLGYRALWSGAMEKARAMLAESLALCCEVGDRASLRWPLCALGHVDRLHGDLPEARRHLEESLAISGSMGLTEWSRINALWGLSRVESLEGRTAEAQACLTEALCLARRQGARGWMTLVLLDLGGLLVAQGHVERAARVLGSCSALTETLGLPLDAESQARYDGKAAEARAALGESAWARAWAAGRAMPLDEACAEALGPDQE